MKELMFAGIGVMLVILISFIFRSCSGKNSVSTSYEERTSESTKEYKQKLLQAVYEEYAHPNAHINYQDHKFDWDYSEDKLKAEWSVHAQKYMVTLKGSSTAIEDIETFDDFIRVSTIDDATVFTLGRNISVLHHYKNKDEINKLISCVRMINDTNFKEEVTTKRKRIKK